MKDSSEVQVRRGRWLVRFAWAREKGTEAGRRRVTEWGGRRGCDRRRGLWVWVQVGMGDGMGMRRGWWGGGI